VTQTLRGAIGVFDSGVGGLSVLRAIHAALPHEHLVYVADSGHAPYGDQSEAHITQRTLTVGHWLAEQGVKGITIACNTATVVAAKTLRDQTCCGTDAQWRGGCAGHAPNGAKRVCGKAG
jgi:glutamate racemase